MRRQRHRSTATAAPAIAVLLLLLLLLLPLLPSPPPPLPPPPHLCCCCCCRCRRHLLLLRRRCRLASASERMRYCLLPHPQVQGMSVLTLVLGAALLLWSHIIWCARPPAAAAGTHLQLHFLATCTLLQTLRVGSLPWRSVHRPLPMPYPSDHMHIHAPSGSSPAGWWSCCCPCIASKTGKWEGRGGLGNQCCPL